MIKKKQGRPMSSRNIRVVPELREILASKKLGRALIAITTNLAKNKSTKEKADTSNSSEDDVVT